MNVTAKAAFPACICIFDAEDLREVICTLSLDNVVEKGQENRPVHVPWFSDLEMWIGKILCVDIL